MKRAFKNSIFFLTFFLSGTFLFGQETIEIYTMNGCGRCAYAIKYAKENNLNFKEYSTEQSANNSKMWSLVQNSGKFGGGSITMPVIAYKGKVAFNIKNLGEYMLKLNNENTSESSTTTNNISNESTSNDEITEILKAHNKYRAEVNIPPLKWSDDLAAYAKEWGEHLVQTGCNLEHRPFTGKWKQQYGENILYDYQVVYTKRKLTLLAPLMRLKVLHLPQPYKGVKKASRSSKINLLPIWDGANKLINVFRTVSLRRCKLPNMRLKKKVFMSTE
jgi:glutaredoxin